MPTYEYLCENHGVIELEHSMSVVLDSCPKCKEENLLPLGFKRLVSNTSFILNGSCWAKDNYGK
jgi:putative FmdB family regulatory protein